MPPGILLSLWLRPLKHMNDGRNKRALLELDSILFRIHRCQVSDRQAFSRVAHVIFFGCLFFQLLRSPKLGRPRNSPATTHARRKLPLSKYDDDDEQVSVICSEPSWLGWIGEEVSQRLGSVRWREVKVWYTLIWPLG